MERYVLLAEFIKEAIEAEYIKFDEAKVVYNHVVATMLVQGTGKLQLFICSLMKLQLNCPGPFLVSLFDVSAASVSQLFLKWLAQMDIRLQDLIIRPDRESLQKTMPECFQESFGKKLQSSSIVSL